MTFSKIDSTVYNRLGITSCIAGYNTIVAYYKEKWRDIAGVGTVGKCGSNLSRHKSMKIMKNETWLILLLLR